MGFTLLSRREVWGDKCPRCSRLNVDFVDLGLGMLGCFDCGCVFLTKLARAQARVKPVEAPVITEVSPLEVEILGEETAAPPVGFTCDVCEKVLKTKLALAGHMRSHLKK